MEPALSQPAPSTAAAPSQTVYPALWSEESEHDIPHAPEMFDTVQTQHGEERYHGRVITSKWNPADFRDQGVSHTEIQDEIFLGIGAKKYPTQGIFQGGHEIPLSFMSRNKKIFYARVIFGDVATDSFLAMEEEGWRSEYSGFLNANPSANLVSKFVHGRVMLKVHVRGPKERHKAGQFSQDIHFDGSPANVMEWNAVAEVFALLNPNLIPYKKLRARFPEITRVRGATRQKEITGYPTKVVGQYDESGVAYQYHQSNKEDYNNERMIWARIYVFFHTDTWPEARASAGELSFRSMPKGVDYDEQGPWPVPSNPDTVSLEAGAMSFTSCVLPFHPITNLGKGWELNKYEGVATLSVPWPTKKTEVLRREHQLREIVNAVAAPVYEVSDSGNVHFEYRKNRGDGHEPKAPDGAVTLAYISAGDGTTEVSRNKPKDVHAIQAVAWHSGREDVFARMSAYFQRERKNAPMMWLQSAFVDRSQAA